VINRAFEIEILQHKIEPCIVEKNLCIIALVGENMKNHQGLSGKMFSTLGKNNVNIRAIAQVLLSETSCGNQSKRCKKSIEHASRTFL
jgi:aspartokinase